MDKKYKPNSVEELFMCGIVGYMGEQEASPIIMHGLKMLQYRGYDSAGICTMGCGSAAIRRSSGKLVNLERLLQSEPLSGTVGIGHTRWATHGKPTVTNAHPHKSGSVVVVHNGIIENYQTLRDQLKRDGHQFESETDTEVISHLIDDKISDGMSFEHAVQKTLMQLVGAYAICVLSEKDERTLIVAKFGSPMIVGINGNEYFVASDMPAIASKAQDMVILEDGEMAVMRDGTVRFMTVFGTELKKMVRRVNWMSVDTEKQGFPHYMLKEIHEQPQAVRNLLAECLLKDNEDILFDGAREQYDLLGGVERLCLIGCGSSWHAALAGKYMIEEHCKIPVDVEIASEFRYRRPVVPENTLIVPISQSGETADTLGALREAKNRSLPTLAVCNVFDSSIARESDMVIYTRAGTEIGVASTKTFTNQVVALYLLAIKMGRLNGNIAPEKARLMLQELVELPSLLEKTLKLDFNAEEVACEHLNYWDAIYLGRGINYPIALEGALKLKEISYIHAEGYPAGEMKHGPIALIDRDMPVFVIAPQDRYLSKVRSNMEEIAARGGRLIVLCTEGDKETAAMAECTLEVPWGGETLSPLLFNAVLQLIAYHFSTLKGKDVDQPRNLAKSVTVE